ncbi:possible porin [Geminocystis sp. NIES-3708]|uniref:iron uptake porin n=1 Tax=Geminocystis sp. NIES-3708 TaxID=1615909 RepID=UPI0005FC469B|nr:iron uptake porin [Geminocystis sp. NIES-3708]BAQ61740.1 possible porin [Geminocystis sp. NIES-3708]
MFLKYIFTILISLFCGLSSSFAQTKNDDESNLKFYFPSEDIDIANSNFENNQEALKSIPSVSQLRSFQQQDWEITALKNLDADYNCLNSLTKNINLNQSLLTRDELASYLQLCLENIDKSKQLGINLKSEDISILNRLAKNLDLELTNLSSQINSLETSLSALKENQFSPTVKMFGLIRINSLSFFSGQGDNSTVLQYSNFTVLNASFTGKDSLFLGFSTTASPLPELAPENDGREIGSTREGTALIAGAGNTNSQTFLTNLKYSFPVNDNLSLTLRGFEFFSRSMLSSNFLPYYNVGDGPVSTFAQMPAIYRLASGAGADLNYKIRDSLMFNLSYYASAGNNPSQGQGLFNGNYIATGRLSYNPRQDFYTEFVYLNGYFGKGSFSYDNGLDFNKGFIGTALANRFDESGVLFDRDANVSVNSYMLLSYFAITPKFLIGGSINKTDARLIGMGDADIWSYWFALTFPDLFKENNLGGFIIGVEPTLTDLKTSLPYEDFKKDTGLHIETYYRFQVNDNISITPALIWINSPNQDKNNQDILMGLVRTSFKF